MFRVILVLATMMAMVHANHEYAPDYPHHDSYSSQHHGHHQLATHTSGNKYPHTPSHSHGHHHNPHYDDYVDGHHADSLYPFSDRGADIAHGHQRRRNDAKDVDQGLDVHVHVKRHDEAADHDKNNARDRAAMLERHRRLHAVQNHEHALAKQAGYDQDYKRTAARRGHRDYDDEYDLAHYENNDHHEPVYNHHPHGHPIAHHEAAYPHHRVNHHAAVHEYEPEYAGAQHHEPSHHHRVAAYPYEYDVPEYHDEPTNLHRLGGARHHAHHAAAPHNFRD